MKINLGLQAKMSHQLVMTPQLQQAIKLLQLSRQELEKLVEQSVVENPTLDIAEVASLPDKSEDEFETSSKEESVAESDLSSDQWEEGGLDKNEAEWQDYTQREYGLIKERSNADNEGYNPSETLLTKHKTLADHVEWQITVWNLTALEKQISKLLLDYLNEDGYLISSITEIAEESEETYGLAKKLAKYYKQNGLLDKNLTTNNTFLAKYSDKETKNNRLGVSLTKQLLDKTISKDADASPTKLKDNKVLNIYWSLEILIRKLQEFDPAGVFSRSLQECLTIQAEIDLSDDHIVLNILKKYFGLLASQELAKIAKILKVDLKQVIEAKDRICTLEPKPGRKYTDDQTFYITPDVFVFKRDSLYIVRINNESIPKLSINSYYKNLSEDMHTYYGSQKNKSDDMNVLASQYLKEKVRAAEWLIRSIDQRQNTILRVSECIVKRQQEFFEYGVEALKPMVLKDVAEDMGVHESTVSRITTNKYMHTPQGIFELKYFFTSGIMQEDGDFISSEKIKDLIYKMISGENSNHPLTDSVLAVKLEKEMNIKVARRTVAKYREAMNISPSNRRKQKF